MGAKFKAPTDSCCSAEEQHFRLPLPSYVCLSFLLLSFHPLVPHFDVPFIASLFHFLAPASFFSFIRPPSLYLASPALILFSIFDPVAHLVLCWPPCSRLLPLCISIQLSSLMPVFQIWQTLIRTQQRGCCPGASLFREPTSNPGYPNRALNSRLSKDNHWSEIDSCSALPSRYLPGSKTYPISPSLALSSCLSLSPLSPSLHHPFFLSKMALPQMFNSSYLLIKRSSKPSIDVKASIWICNHPLQYGCCAQRNFPRIFW